MKRSIVRSALAATVLATVLVGSGGQAHAWYKIKNGTANTVWVSHAFSSTQRFLCGWDDGCADATSSGWRVEGWWMIAPGGTSTVHGKGFGNAYHQIYAHDGVGHVWAGGNGSGWFGTPDSAFSRCEGLFTEEQSMPYYSYRPIRTSWCCGGSCVGDYTTTLTL